MPINSASLTAQNILEKYMQKERPTTSLTKSISTPTMSRMSSLTNKTLITNRINNDSSLLKSFNIKPSTVIMSPLKMNNNSFKTENFKPNKNEVTKSLSSIEKVKSEPTVVENSDLKMKEFNNRQVQSELDINRSNHQVNKVDSLKYIHELKLNLKFRSESRKMRPKLPYLEL